MWDLKFKKGFSKRRDAIELAQAIKKDFGVTLITKRKKARRKK